MKTYVMDKPEKAKKVKGGHSSVSCKEGGAAGVCTYGSGFEGCAVRRGGGLLLVAVYMLKAGANGCNRVRDPLFLRGILPGYALVKHPSGPTSSLHCASLSSWWAAGWFF